MEENTTLNIIYLPDEQTRNIAIELSQKLAEQLPTKFILNNQNPIPHITIYQALFPTKNLEKIKEIVKKIVSQTKSFEVEMNEFATSEVPGFVWWNCLKTDQLEEIQSEILKEINPLREDLIAETLKTYKVTPKQKDQIEKYGAILAHPHITITKLKDAKDGQRTLEILGEEEYSKFKIDKIVFGQMGANGTVTGIIESFPLLP